MMTELTSFLPLIKDLGFPIVCIYYIFKAYQERVAKSDIREDKYALVIENHSKDCAQLALALATLAQEIRTESTLRQDLLSKLVQSALDSRERV